MLTGFKFYIDKLTKGKAHYEGTLTLQSTTNNWSTIGLNYEYQDVNEGWNYWEPDISIAAATAGDKFRLMNTNTVGTNGCADIDVTTFVPVWTGIRLLDDPATTKTCDAKIVTTDG